MAVGHHLIMSMDDEYFETIAGEARGRGVRVQMLIRAVIIPEWIRSTTRTGSKANKNGQKIAKVVAETRKGSPRSLYFRDNSG